MAVEGGLVFEAFKQHERIRRCQRLKEGEFVTARLLARGKFQFAQGLA